MLDESTRNAIALKRFSLISPILNGQVSNISDYCISITESPVEMPHYGTKMYSPKTINNWFCDYMKHGIDGLKPKPRADKGGTRKISSEMEHILIEKRKEYPRVPITVIFEMLLNEGILAKDSISLSTIGRFYNKCNPSLFEDDSKQKELKRFAHQKVNQLWQTDVLYGPYVKVNGKKQQTYLMAYIDDASRLITHAQFYFSQDLLSLRHSLKEALLRRGIPKLLYTDNGRIYRSQSFEYLCANMGIALIRAEPFTPNSKGKIERFFRSCRMRFLSALNPTKIKDIDELNNLLWQWLHDDYQRKPHSSLNKKSPSEYFLEQSASIELITDLSAFNKKFLISVNRKIKHDATLSLHSSLYETIPALAGTNITVKYDPDELENGIPEVFLFKDDKPVGTARKVFLHDNAHVKRSGKSKAQASSPDMPLTNEPISFAPVHTISFAEMVMPVGKQEVL